ncbi:MAG: autotransporter outer membrane beta-barrel domain-containing protein [Candidatus Melainabacteria bacterium]|nr:autotransporter outer membrane beta-barrel domain-containing protein [Candidatus Melainabacteria bacterium]
MDRTAKSKPRLSHGRLDLEIGTDIGGCHFRVQPFVSGSAEGYHQDKVHEHGAGSINLKIRPITKWLASTEAGAHITFNYFKWTTIALDMGWQHYYGNLRVSEETHFEDFGTLFLIEGPRRGHDGGVGALYVSQKLGSSWEIYGEATGEIWRNWHAYEFNGGVSYKW